MSTARDLQSAAKKIKHPKPPIHSNEVAECKRVNGIDDPCCLLLNWKKGMPAWVCTSFAHPTFYALDPKCCPGFGPSAEYPPQLVEMDQEDLTARDLDPATQGKAAEAAAGKPTKHCRTNDRSTKLTPVHCPSPAHFWTNDGRCCPDPHNTDPRGLLPPNLAPSVGEMDLQDLAVRDMQSATKEESSNQRRVKGKPANYCKQLGHWLPNLTPIQCPARVLLWTNDLRCCPDPHYVDPPSPLPTHDVEVGLKALTGRDLQSTAEKENATSYPHLAGKPADYCQHSSHRTKKTNYHCQSLGPWTQWANDILCCPKPQPCCSPELESSPVLAEKDVLPPRVVSSDLEGLTLRELQSAAEKEETSQRRIPGKPADYCKVRQGRSKEHAIPCPSTGRGNYFTNDARCCPSLESSSLLDGNDGLPPPVVTPRLENSTLSEVQSAAAEKEDPSRRRIPGKPADYCKVRQYRSKVTSYPCKSAGNLYYTNDPRCCPPKESSPFLDKNDGLAPPPVSTELEDLIIRDFDYSKLDISGLYRSSKECNRLGVAHQCCNVTTADSSKGRWAVCINEKAKKAYLACGKAKCHSGDKRLPGGHDTELKDLVVREVSWTA